MKKIILKENLGVSTKSVKGDDVNQNDQLTECYRNTYNTLRRMNPKDDKCPYNHWITENKR